MNNTYGEIKELFNLFFFNKNEDIEKLPRDVQDKKKIKELIEKDDIEVELVKNIVIFELAEKMRFAKLQRESLRDTSTYNRHIAKSLTEMNHALTILLELGVDYEEISPSLEMYYQFNRHVNTPEHWEEFYYLKKYPLFIKFLEIEDI